MSEHKRYQHLEKLGSTEVEGILLGDVWIYPKIDGSNGCVWYSDKEMHYSSRNRKLTLDNDNQGFMATMSKNDALIDMCTLFYDWRFYGEWLVPHSLKTYRDNAWRKFYIFDATLQDEDGSIRYMPPEELHRICVKYGLHYIPPLKQIKNPTIEDVLWAKKNNTFLIKENEGIGEGVVMKNYSFVNKYGRVAWAKSVTNEFKEKHNNEMGHNKIERDDTMEQVFVDTFLTKDITDKIIANITSENDGWSSKFIPRLLGTATHDLVKEHTWDMIKKNKNPTINFKDVNLLAIRKVKEQHPNLF